MAQTVLADSARNGKTEISANGSSWTDISGQAGTLTTSGGARQTGETYTFDGDNAIVTVGKSTPVTITGEFVYTESATEAFEVARAIWEGTNVLYVRFSPLGGQTGEKVFTAGPGRMSAFNYPNLVAGGGAAIMGGFTYTGPKPVVSTAA